MFPINFIWSESTWWLLSSGVRKPGALNYHTHGHAHLGLMCKLPWRCTFTGQDGANEFDLKWIDPVQWLLGQTKGRANERTKTIPSSHLFPLEWGVVQELDAIGGGLRVVGGEYIQWQILCQHFHFMFKLSPWLLFSTENGYRNALHRRTKCLRNVIKKNDKLCRQFLTLVKRVRIWLLINKTDAN